MLDPSLVGRNKSGEGQRAAKLKPQHPLPFIGSPGSGIEAPAVSAGPIRWQDLPRAVADVKDAPHADGYGRRM
jgi:hypothetical protein